MSNPNTPNVLIRLTTDEFFIAISTFCRAHGRRRRFLVSRDLIGRLLDGSIAMLYTRTAGTISVPTSAMAWSASRSTGSASIQMAHSAACASV